MTTIVIADRHDRTRHGYRMVLSTQPDLSVVGEAADAVTTWRLVNRLRPDVLLTDMWLPGTQGLQLTRRIVGEPSLGTRVIVVTTHREKGSVHQALREGANGFLLKASAPGLLVQAVRAASAGDALIGPEVTNRLLEWMGTDGQVAREPVPALTPRERDVARLVARGLSNEEIGADLHISAGTVKTHVAHVATKLGNVNRVGIAAWAWESGLVTHAVRRVPRRRLASPGLLAAQR